MALPKIFRHAAKTATAAIGDFERPLYPFLGRVAKVAIEDAAEQIAEPAAEPVSYEAEIAATMASFSIRMKELRRTCSPSELGAAMQGLKAEKALALLAIKERRRAKADSNRAARKSARLERTKPEPKG